jgi:hypothetical protein
MGLSNKATNRLLSVSFVVTLLVGISTKEAYQTALTAIVLCTLIGFIWVISTKDTSFEYLGINNKALVNAFAFIVSIIALSQYCISLWGSPFVGTYVLSLTIVGIFWWTIDSLQPSTS